MKHLYYSIVLLTLSVSFPCYAGETGLPIPRFVSLRSDEVNMRTGPGNRYPIEWIYKKTNLPVEIINEFDTWRKIRDITGDEGWVHQSMVSGNRTTLVTEEIRTLHTESNRKSRVTARFEPGVIVSVKECIPAWCAVSAEGFEGWMEKTSLWGVYKNEVF